MKITDKPKIKIPNFLKSVRYVLLSVSSLYLITGFLLLIVGVVVLNIYAQYEDLITGRFFALPAFVIATAVIIILSSPLGFYGAISKNFYVIVGYVCVLVMILVFEMSMVIVAYGLMSDAVLEIRPTMRTSLDSYFIRTEVAKMWDLLQMRFDCCGIIGPMDFVSNQVPVSCCVIEYGQIGSFLCIHTNANQVGCSTELGDWLSYYAFVIAICGLVVTGLQVGITAAAGWMAWRAKDGRLEFEP